MSKEIKLTQGKVVIVDDENYEWLNQWKWFAKNRYKDNWYAARQKGPAKKQITVLMHREILGLKKGDTRDADHIDHNGLNNRKINMRICSRQQNTYNQKVSERGTSKYKGVSWHKANKKWTAYITSKYLGSFINENDAAFAYDYAARQLFGQFACCNFKESKNVA